LTWGCATLGEAASNIQLCGAFAVELAGRRVDQALPGRQGRLLFAYLVLSRLERVSRETLIDALWGDSPPAAAAAALNVVISKVRAALGPDVLHGRAELYLKLPEPVHIDVETATSALHAAESAVALRDWRRAWAFGLTAQFVGRRRFLPESDAPWVASWRRRLGETHARALECYAAACLELGGPELPGAERAARELVEVAPLRETGQLLLMRALAVRGNVAEALAAYERFRIILRDELGIDPAPALQDTYASLLG
jgi:SARP family transcriptional regulator, regulator of embCAB operon